MNKMLVNALALRNKGLSVIPVGADKKPLISWLEFQSRIATGVEVEGWWEKYPEAQLGIVTGKISGITVVDVEAEGDWNFLPQDTLISKTGGGGRHYFFKYEEGVKNSTRIRDFVDIRGEGGYVIAPPSVSSKGDYKWINTSPTIPFPKELFEIKSNTLQGNYKKYDTEYNGFSEGQRNDEMARYIGHLLAKIHPTEQETIAWQLVKSANQKNTPPLDEYELRSVFESIASAEGANSTERWYREQDTVEFEKKDDYKLRYTWGTEELDNNFAIIKRSNFAVVGAARSEGKTTYTFDMACKNASLGHKVVYISLEMEGYEIKQDFARKYSGITIPEERDYNIPEHKQKAFQRKIDEIDKIKTLHFEGVRRGEGTTWRHITGLISKYPDVDLVYIDNLDLIEGSEIENDLTRQKNIVKNIMRFTVGNNIPIFLIHHYRKKSGKTYGMDELSGSGKISDGADIIVKITRNKDPEAEYPEKYKSKIYLQKARGYNEASKEIYFIKGTFVDYPDNSNSPGDDIDVNKIKWN